MKILKRLWCLILILFALVCALVLVCAFNPQVTEALADFLYPERSLETNGEDGSGLMGTSKTGWLQWSEEEAESPGADAGKGESLADEKGPESKLISGTDGIQAGAMGLDEGLRSEYVSPDQTQLTIPENVSGRNGYESVTDEGGVIEDTAVRALQSQLGTGSTGDGLVFDSNFYPYYAMLDEKGKHLYRQIYANANDLNEAFAPVEETTAPELKTVFAAVYNDHPELFWMETAYLGKYRRDGRCVEIDLRFNRTARDLEAEKAVFNQRADEILAQAQALGSDYEKEKLVHDILLVRITYNRGAEMNQSAYSALVNGQSVCAGYARAFQYLMQQLGIPCYYCTGCAGESHAWNIIRLEDGYYNVDTTWDDVDDGNYDFFNRTDQDYADTHIRQELSVYLPPCEGVMYRSLEQSGQPGGQSPEQPGAQILPGIEEIGVAESEVLHSLEDYYDNCRSQVLAGGTGSFTFTNVIEGEELMEECYRAYQTENYRQGYMDQVMDEVGASACQMNLGIEELAGDRYMVTHTLTLR